MSKPKIYLIFSFFFITVSLSILTAEDWPRWRGLQGDSIYRGDDWDYGKLNGNPLWSIGIGDGFSAPSIKDGKLVTLGFENGKDVIQCFDALSGSKIWDVSYDSISGGYPGPRSTPAIDGNRVYTMSRLGVLYCLDLQSGREIWKKDLDRDLRLSLPEWHLAGSPVIKGNSLYLNVNRHGAALNKRDGSIIWKSPSDVPGYASPVIYSQDGRENLAMFGKNKIYSVDPADGSVLWSYDWRTSYDVNAADPFYLDGKMFISTAYNKGALMLDISGRRPKEIWTNRSIASHFSSFVEYEGKLYGNSGTAGRSFSASTVCLDPESGTVLWQERNGFGSLILAGDKLIILNESGNLMIAEAREGAYEELKTIQAPGGQYWTAPVMANGLLYVRSSGGELTCYDLRR